MNTFISNASTSLLKELKNQFRDYSLLYENKTLHHWQFVMQSNELFLRYLDELVIENNVTQLKNDYTNYRVVISTLKNDYRNQLIEEDEFEEQIVTATFEMMNVIKSYFE